MEGEGESVSLTPAGVGLSCVIFYPAPLALFPHSGILVLLMAEKLDPNDLVTLEGLALSNMREMTLSH